MVKKKDKLWGNQFKTNPAIRFFHANKKQVFLGDKTHHQAIWLNLVEKKALYFNPRTYKGGVDATPPIRFFPNFEKRIYFTMLKLSVAVHSSFAEILICQPCVHDIWRCHGNVTNTSRSCQKASFLTFFFIFSSFFNQTWKIYLFLHSISILAWFCINFRYFVTF